MKTVDSFDAEIKKAYGKKSIVDGITNMSKYKKAYPKILWILKEANNSHTDNPDENQRDFHANVTCYKMWKLTFKRIISCSYGMIYKKKRLNVDENACINGVNVMLDIALINVNKCGGCSRSNNSSISAKYNKYKDVILAQVEQINPDVIINCSRVWNLTTDLREQFGLNGEIKKRNARVYCNNEKVLIDYYHPNSTRDSQGGLTDERYYNVVVGTYKKWKMMPPIK